MSPFVVRYDAGSAPVGYLVLESKTRNIGEIQDAAYIRVRPYVVSLPGVSAPPPFGGNKRTIVVHLDPGRLRSYHLSPDEVIAALNAGNTITPAGNARIQDQMPSCRATPWSAIRRSWATSPSAPVRRCTCATWALSRTARTFGLCAYALVSLLVIGLVGPRLGQEIFPNVDSGQFQLRVRAPAGTRIEQTEEIGLQALEIIKDVAGPDNVEISVGFGGVSPSSYTINTVYVWTGGPEEVLLRVALKHDSGQRIDDLKHRLREELPERLGAWLRTAAAHARRRRGSHSPTASPICVSPSSRPTSLTRS